VLKLCCGNQPGEYRRDDMQRLFRRIVFSSRSKCLYPLCCGNKSAKRWHEHLHIVQCRYLFGGRCQCLLSVRAGNVLERWCQSMHELWVWDLPGFGAAVELYKLYRGNLPA